MKYNVGDRVRIKSLDWYNENKNEDGNVDCGEWDFTEWHTPYCGEVMTIRFIWEDYGYYKMFDSDNHWTDEMIEGLVEESVSIDVAVEETTKDISDKVVDTLMGGLMVGKSFNLPEGYVFKDENGNIINATKIVLEKKKKEYPKTYEECMRILGFTTVYTPKVEPMFDYDDDIIALQKLKNCRNAYWKLYGEEMGLGKPWKPDWDAKDRCFYTIHTFNGEIDCSGTAHRNAVLIFPTPEMRDAFKENFDPDIEKCKEFL